MVADRYSIGAVTESARPEPLRGSKKHSGVESFEPQSLLPETHFSKMTMPSYFPRSSSIKYSNIWTYMGHYHWSHHMLVQVGDSVNRSLETVAMASDISFVDLQPLWLSAALNFQMFLDDLLMWFYITYYVSSRAESWENQIPDFNASLHCSTSYIFVFPLQKTKSWWVKHHSSQLLLGHLCTCLRPFPPVIICSNPGPRSWRHGCL